MKLKDLIEAVRGLDDRGFLQRFPHPFLLEEGLLRRETRSLERSQLEGGTSPDVDELGERQVFPIIRRDGKPGDVALGRGPLMDIRLDAQSVSSRHAVFKGPGDGRARWCVVDTVSTNGTFVDGVRIATGREVELSEATVIRFGPDLRLAFYEPGQLLSVLRQIADAKAAAVATAAKAAAAAARVPAPAPRAAPASPAIKKVLDEALVETDVIRREDVAARSKPPAPALRTDDVRKVGSGRYAAIKAASEGDAPGNKTETALQVPPLLGDGLPPRTPAPKSVGADAIVVLSCEPFAPVPLELHKPIVIGRVPGNDFVLPNPQVSRRHTEVERVREGVVVRDLKSANGTFVEDRRIDRQTVPFGGVFRIGPYALEVRVVDAGAHATGPIVSFGDTIVSSARAQDGLRGTFDDMPLTEMLSGVEFNQKTGVIDIQGDDGTAGFVSFRGGAPCQARCGKLEGEQAVLALLRIKKGRFILRSDEAAVGPRGIDVGFTKILLEHGRISDESKKK